MKKFLLSLAVTMTAVCGAFAQTVIKATQIDLDKAKNIDGYTVEVLKNAGQTKPAMNGDVLRLYADNTLSISGEKITKVVVALASTGSKRYTTFTPNVGALTTAQAAGDTEITWAGDASSVVFTVGAKATMGTDGESKAGQVHISEITVYGEGGGTVTPDPIDPDPIDPDPVDPDPADIVGNGTEANPYTVADVIALNNSKPGNAWVKGYIVGSSNSGATLVFTPATEKQSASNVLIAVNPNETDITKMVPIQLVAGSDVRKAVNLLDNPGNIGKELYINGSLEKYFGQPGIKTPSAYKLDGQGTTPIDPTPDVPTTGPGSADQPYTVAEAIAKDNNGSYGWVNGYIVGVMAYNEKNYFTATELTVNSNIVIAASADETDEANMICVQLPAGSKVRESLNLVDRPGNLGKEVSVCGQLVKYCGIHGVKETSDYTIVGGVAPIPVEETPSLTSFVEEQSESNLKITGTVTVYYQSPDKKYTFITDGETNLEIYGALPEYKNGDQLTGIVGKFSFYQNMPQMTPQTDSFGAATAGAPVEPTEVAFNQISIAQYVKVIAIEIYEEDGKFYIGQGDAKRQVFDRFALGTLKAGVCTITGIGAIYGETAQIFPTELDYKNVNSIDEITAGNAKAEIYDLQGRKVAKAANGVYIVNGKKTFIR